MQPARLTCSTSISYPFVSGHGIAHGSWSPGSDEPVPYPIAPRGNCPRAPDYSYQLQWITVRPFCCCRSLSGRPISGYLGRVSAARARSFRQPQWGPEPEGRSFAVADLSERTTKACGHRHGAVPAPGPGASNWNGAGRWRCRRGSNYSRPIPTATRDFSGDPDGGRNPGPGGRAATRTGLRSANDRTKSESRVGP